MSSAGEKKLTKVFLLPPSAVLGGKITIPGSKSFTNRALILAAQAQGESYLQGASASDDSEALAKALRDLGVTVEWREAQQGEEKALAVKSAGAPFSVFFSKKNKGANKSCYIDVGPAGTAYRFLTALGTLVCGCEITLDGNVRMRERPIGPLVKALQSVGGAVAFLGKEGFPPLRINQETVPLGGEVIIDSSVSSQFISALLMVGGSFQHGLRLKLRGKKVSSSYLEMTLATLKEFGVEVAKVPEGYLIAGGSKPQARTFKVEGDASGAGYFWGMAAISGRCLRIANISRRSCQGDLQLLPVLERMGCQVREGQEGQCGWIEVTGPRELHSISADLNSFPDSAQTIAVVAACAKGVSRLTGLETLRTKETDRIAALATELKRIGIECREEAAALEIVGGVPRAGEVETYGDHRMAMAFAMLAGKTSGIVIKDPEVATLFGIMFGNDLL